MKNLIIHIGFPKCASTYFQNVLINNTHINFLGKFIHSSDLKSKADRDYEEYRNKDLTYLIDSLRNDNELKFEQKLDNINKILNNLCNNSKINFLSDESLTDYFKIHNCDIKILINKIILIKKFIKNINIRFLIINRKKDDLFQSFFFQQSRNFININKLYYFNFYLLHQLKYKNELFLKMNNHFDINNFFKYLKEKDIHHFFLKLDINDLSKNVIKLNFDKDLIINLNNDIQKKINQTDTNNGIRMFHRKKFSKIFIFKNFSFEDFSISKINYFFETILVRYKKDFTNSQYKKFIKILNKY